jgi:xylulokinase
MGCGFYKDHDEAFASLKRLAVIEPDLARRDEYLAAYERWKSLL